MAPAVTIKGTKKVNLSVGQYKEVGYGPESFNKENEIKGIDKHAPATYPHYLPTWEGDNSYGSLEPFEHVEHGRDADPKLPNLLPDGKADVSHISPKFGSEVHGIQLSTLTNAGKDELALFVAQRGVVAFRDQDFADLSIQQALDFGGYFGRHHIHPTSGQPKGFPGIHLVHRGAGGPSENHILETRTSSVAWHSDVTYEIQPPGTTFLYALDIPQVHGKYSGGDTAFVSQVEAYNRFSESFRKRLEGLTAVHSAHEQAGYSRERGGVVRREPVTSEHPIIRTHPATGRKALFVNLNVTPSAAFQCNFNLLIALILVTRCIVGYKKEESDALLKFLYDHIAYGIDFQIRVKWEPRTVVWDNRVTAHSALFDWDNGGRRHLARITPQAERPFEG